MDPDETWQDHTDCEWTWPSAHGVIGCLDHEVVFEAPTGERAWTAAGAWSRK